MLAVIEALVVLAVVLIAASTAYALLRRSGAPQVTAPESPARWVATHYSVDTVT
jgi:hypothetical protein